jgi:ubiquinone biosynthesis monooxygenase Coq7
MRADEIAHADSARAAGAVELPRLIRGVMRGTAMVMTQTAYWI